MGDSGLTDNSTTDRWTPSCPSSEGFTHLWSCLTCCCRSPSPPSPAACTGWWLASDCRWPAGSPLWTDGRKRFLHWFLQGYGNSQLCLGTFIFFVLFLIYLQYYSVSVHLTVRSHLWKPLLKEGGPKIRTNTQQGNILQLQHVLVILVSLNQFDVMNLFISPQIWTSGKCRFILNKVWDVVYYTIVNQSS